MMVGNLSEYQSYGALCFLCSLLLQTEVAFGQDPLLRRKASWTVLKASNPPCLAAG